VLEKFDQSLRQIKARGCRGRWGRTYYARKGSACATIRPRTPDGLAGEGGRSQEAL